MKMSHNYIIKESIKEKSVSEIATIIKNNWANVHFAAIPYLDAMHGLNSVNEKYGLDDGKSIVMYFLSNARSWRGETARMVKKELNRRCK